MTKKELEAELVETSEKLAVAQKQIEQLQDEIVRLNNQGFPFDENLERIASLERQVQSLRTENKKLRDELDQKKEELDHFQEISVSEVKSESENGGASIIFASIIAVAGLAVFMIWAGLREAPSSLPFPETIRADVFLHRVTPPVPEPAPTPVPEPEPSPEPEISIGDWMDRELEKYNPSADDKKKVRTVIDETIKYVKKYPRASEADVTNSITWFVGKHAPRRLRPFFTDFGNELKRRVDGGETVQSLIEQLK